MFGPEHTENVRSFDPALSDAEFRQIAMILRDEAGLHLADTKIGMVHSRLVKRLRAIGVDTFEQYCGLIQDRHGNGERRRMVAALTTKLTRFFRESHHFEHLAGSALPSLVSLARRGKRVRLWSAGCSTGQEPYSIAMTILSLMPDAGAYDIRILATDIDPDALEVGARGEYSSADAEHVPLAYRHRWIGPAADPDSDVWRISDEARKLVSFRELNLVGSWPMKGTFDAIFCRNVVIYFDDQTQTSLWKRLCNALSPGGLLYIGHSERIDLAVGPFNNVGVTTYRLAEIKR